MRDQKGLAYIAMVLLLAAIGIVVAINLPTVMRNDGEKVATSSGKMQERVHQERVDFVTKPARLEVFPGQHKAVTDSNVVLPGTYMVTFERTADAVGAESFPFTGFASSGDIRKGDEVLVYRVIYNQSILDSERSPLLIMKKP